MFLIVPTISRILGVAGIGAIIAFIVGLFNGEGEGLGIWDSITGLFGGLFS